MNEPSRPTARRLSAVRAIAIALLVPVVLILTNIRLLLTPAFVSIEYRTPGFPEDSYGFTLAERMQQAEIARAYLLNDAGPEFLGTLRDQAGTLLYNARELSHMVDVKELVQKALAVWSVLAVLLVGVGVAAWRFGQPGSARGGLHLGAALTLVLMAALIGLLLLSFSFLFTGFHNVFFQSGTWTFYYSDTLIRLFPIRFWRDVFALLMILTVAEAALLWLGTKPDVHRE
jgi:integral membrane protein (TIGR01906 family)